MAFRSNKTRKSYIFFILLAVILGIFTYTLGLNKNRVSKLPILEGNIKYSVDAEGFYKKSLLYIPEVDSNWQFGENFGTSNQPAIAGESGFLFDLNTGKVLFEKNATQKMKIASLTKIMTALVALEHKNIDDKIYVTRNAAYVGENTMNLTRGEVYSLKELLYGLMLNSGNDAAYAIAEGVALDPNTFVKWMNIKAVEIGLTDTLFYDPSGLDDRTYSTVHDLAKLSRYAMRNKEFAQIVKTPTAEFISDVHKYVYLENQTNLLTTYPGVAGIKTGYTEDAGLCLATYASYEGKEVIGVVLNSVDRKGDMILMLDHGFATVGVKVEHNLLN